MMMMMNRLAVLFFALLVAAQADPSPEEHRKLQLGLNEKAIANQFVVELSPEVADIRARAEELLQGTGANLMFTYGRAFRGFTVSSLALRFVFRLLAAADVVKVTQVRSLVRFPSLVGESFQTPYATFRFALVLCLKHIQGDWI